MNVPTANKQIIFVDSSVQDYQSLIQNADAAQIFILNDNLSGIDQITNALAAQKDIEAVHILSHGSPGSLKLGADTLNDKEIKTFSTQIKQWGNALTENGEIHLYGCDVAAGETGIKFVKELSELTLADVAASNNTTGNAELGGDWNLEVETGSIETSIPFNSESLKTYKYILPAVANPDNKGVTVNSAATSIDVLANDTGSSRVSVQSITTAPTNGTATINDWIYAGGAFTTVNGTVRNNIARLNSDGSVDTAFNPSSGMDNSVEAIAIDSSGKLYAGGFFTNVNGTFRNQIARMNADGSLDTAFNPTGGMNSAVEAIAIDSSGKPYVGGNFTTVNGTARNRIARMNADGSLDTAFTPSGGMNNQVQAIAVDSSGKPYVGGYFTTVNGTARNYIARMNADGSLDTAFNPTGGMSNVVWAIALDSSGKLYAGGYFNNVNGTARNYIARMNADGSLDTAFNPTGGMNNFVSAIAVDSSGKPYVGGEFTTVNGTARTRIARMNANGSLDTAFNPTGGMNSTVQAIALDSSGKPVVGGQFTTVNGTTRNYIARMNTDGTLDTTFNPGTGMNGEVRAIAVNNKSSILYTPTANFNGVDTFTYTATDGVVSTPTTVSVLVNNSPTLDSSGTPTLNAQNQNDSASTGTLISTIITNLGGTKITDPNASASQGIAITALNTANGTWQYTTNGTNWNNAPAVSATNALLLASDANTKLRFVPNTGYNGTVANAITFAAWDRIVGTNGTTANYTTDRTNNTTSSVFSSAIETANITINPVPTITSVTSTTANGSYGIGTNIDITVQFSQIVNVTGTPQLSLAGATPVASYLSGTGSNTLTFRYVVAAGDSSADLDYLSTTALSLSGGTIKNAATGDAILTLPTPAAANSLGANKAIVIDTLAPTVTSITSTTADGSYNTTGNINVTVNFSEALTLAGGSMTVALDTGGTVTIAPFTGTSAVGTYTPAAGQNSTDLNSISITLGGSATLKDAAGNNATLTIPAGQSLANSKALVVDTLAPTVTLTSASPTTTNAPFLVTATFSESVTGFIDTDVTVANGTVSGFTGTGTTYNFTVTPNADGPVTVDISAARATDTAGNNNTAATQLVRTADATVPTVTLTSASPTTTNAPFLVTATFSESVTGFIDTDVTVANGTVSGFTGTGTTYNFTVTPNADGPVTVDIPAARATDTAGNNNTAATQLVRTADATVPTV
ncbi:DUF4347 domain-containing protein, partial [Microcoleus sp. D3_18_C4]|uniref:DUF4347 domain-containing protein n=1 Tax=Microcoleus sp. D3_18_C4 TaxID=3055335 RepID=UPI002FCF3AD1